MILHSLEDCLSVDWPETLGAPVWLDVSDADLFVEPFFLTPTLVSYLSRGSLYLVPVEPSDERSFIWYTDWLSKLGLALARPFLL